MNKDTITGIVGAVLLIAAMGGVFWYERGRAMSALDDEVVTFAQATNPGPTATGTVAVAASDGQLINITKQNLTSVTFTLTWAASGGGANTLQLSVQPPDAVGNVTDSPASSTGTIEVTIAVPNAEPTDGPLTLGVGNWGVTVSFTQATGPQGLPLQTDTSQAYTLTTSFKSWEPQAAA